MHNVLKNQKESVWRHNSVLQRPRSQSKCLSWVSHPGGVPLSRYGSFYIPHSPDHHSCSYYNNTTWRSICKPIRRSVDPPHQMKNHEHPRLCESLLCCSLQVCGFQHPSDCQVLQMFPHWLSLLHSTHWSSWGLRPSDRPWRPFSWSFWYRGRAIF